MPTKLSVFCEKVIEAGWLLALVIKNLTLIYQRLGRTDEALSDARRALELSPERDRPAIQKFIDQLK